MKNGSFKIVADSLAHLTLSGNSLRLTATGEDQQSTAKNAFLLLQEHLQALANKE